MLLGPWILCDNFFLIVYNITVTHDGLGEGVTTHILLAP